MAEPPGRSGASKPERRSRRHRDRQLTVVQETSAGGLAVDSRRDHAVLIGRLDRRGRTLWSLPKGHIEDGETSEQTAIREVREETGIRAHVLCPLGTIDYWFIADRRRIHKTVHHFLLEARDGTLSDADPEVSEVAWIPLGELDHTLVYTDERKLACQARKWLREAAP